MNLALGVYDAPENQAQPILRYDLMKANLAVFGSPMSGKTTFIKTILIRMCENIGKGPEEQVYIIDFGGNLGDYSKLPVICGYFDNSNEENIKRVFKVLDQKMRQNSNALNSRNYYLTAEKNPDECPPHLILIIENINAFLADERYATYQDQLMKFCRDGISKGMTVIFTANDTGGVSRYLTNFGYKTAFNMPPESYIDIFGAKAVFPMRMPGRGLATVDSKLYEFQAFVPFNPATEEEDLKAFLDRFSDYENPERLVAFPEILTGRNIHEYSSEPLPNRIGSETDLIIFGLDYYTHKPLCVDIRESRSIGIYGKRKFGKTNLLKLLVAQIWNYHKDARFILLDDGRKQLQEIVDMGKAVNTVLFENATDLRRYLNVSGYGATMKNEGTGMASKPVVTETPYTVFIMQGKMLYQNSIADAKYLMNSLFPEMIGNAEAKQYLFIFSDIRNISEVDVRDRFNSSLSVAFLLDNIGEFITEKGTKTAFGEMDPRELKAEYARCSIGDGYYYDLEADALSKVKFIKY